MYLQFLFFATQPENVIHRNIKRKEIIEKIATGLGIDLNEYISKSPDYTLNKNQIDPELYDKASKMVLNVLTNKSLGCPKHEVEVLTGALYEFLLENKEVSDEIAKAFCQGMIKHALKNFMITKKRS
ncbi:hypothetical protein NF27_DS00010 [Candidatus Jidaibacter acanthamoeba]|uniref:Uncharacterized protein n=1 Tax=Candidatus Jidaibacter acanthamoebae TaxID=86105 RepID=A0A0C1QIT1_9RICK|nr:hypothetical protein NF27_DS00010 [Candidatus Jidaibacter acanthamoeba]